MAGALLVTAMLLALLPMQAAYAGPADVEGTVFRDLNFDGTFDFGEPGEAGITVVATDADGTTSSTTTTANGSYVVDTSTLTGDVRIEFQIPDSMSRWLTSGPLGTNNRSDVVHVAQGSTAVDFGVVNGSQFCQDNPDVVTNCYIEGDQLSGGDVLVRTEFLASGDGVDGPGTPEYVVADATVIGTTYGLAVQTFNDHDPTNDVIWAAAFMKRFAGYGPGGADTIYRLDQSGALLGQVTIEAGSHVHDFTVIDGEVVDAASFERVGKEGFGDIDLSEDQNDLYVVNLFDQSLYRVDVDPASPTYQLVENSWSLTALPGQGCAGTIRPGAVGVQDGKVYVGTTCDDATTAWVHSLDPATGVFTLEVTVPLAYSREFVGNNTGYTAEWNPWQDTFAANVTGWGGNEVANQQPWLIDIEFDNTGMTIGFRDRYADQTGSNAPSPEWPADTGLYSTDAAGDIVRACRELDGSYALEGTGSCAVLNGGGAASGPNGPEWFDGDIYLSGGVPGHEEISHGGLVAHPVRNEVLMTAYDALDDSFGEYAFSQGLARLDIPTGDKVGQYRVVGDIFGKAAGLGDLEAFCLGAPLEIGNYVWQDLDLDGIQDPGEPPLEGVTVRHVETGAVAVTDATGYYSFGVEAGAAYTLTFDTSTAVGVDPTRIELSPADAGDNDEIDSDATIPGGVGLPTITGTAGQGGDNDHSLDVGFYERPENRLGNLIFHDINDNAAVDDGEPGIGGVTVQLFLESGDTPGFDGSDTLVDTTTTDANGEYWFQNLGDLTYYVALPDQSANSLTVNGQPFSSIGLRSSTGGNLVENDIDNVDDGDATAGFVSVSGPVTLADGGEPTGEFDVNADPDRDAEAYVEANGADDVDDAASNLTVDLGVVSGNRVGNLVWVDGLLGEAGFNNGVADAAEAAAGIGGVTVELYVDSASGGTPGVYDAGVDVLVATTTTDANGNYWFNGVPDGSYFAAIPAGQTGQSVGGNPVDLDRYISSTAAVSGANDEVDDADDADPGSGFAALTGAFDVASTSNPVNEFDDFDSVNAGVAETEANTNNAYLPDAASDLTIDFGFVEPPRYALGNLVWLDLDDDGLADADEDGIGNVTVQLYQDGVLVDTVTTDVDGHYEFDDLLAGDYTVVIPNGQTGQTIDGATVDLGTYLPGSVSTADPSDDADNDNNGVDAPAGLTSGTISVGDPNQFSPSEPTNETLRDGDPTDDDPALEDENRNLTLDFGFVEPLRVGNLVWLDDGGAASGTYTEADEDDGVADFGELGISGVLMQLIDDGGVVIAETVTDANGNYWFDGLYAGRYQVGIPTAQVPTLDALAGINPAALSTVRSSLGLSIDGEIADDDDDGDPSGVFASLSNIFELAHRTEAIDELGDFADGGPGSAETSANVATFAHRDDSSNLEIDFGFAPIPTYRLGNLVWEDRNADGVADVLEPGVSGILVQLLDENGDVIAETVTGADGHYLFDGLPAGDYQVRLPDDQTPLLGAQPDVVPGRFDDYKTVDGPVVDPDDPADVDNDNNGVDSVGMTSGTVTLGEGDENDEPTGEVERNGSGVLDEDATMRDDRSNLTVDFALERLYQVGNLVWEDYDNDGVAETGEPGIAGVLMQLLDESGDVIAETVTDTDGHYLFTDLQAGDYQVRIPEDQTPVLGPQASIVADVLDELETSGTPTVDPDNPDETDNDNDGTVNTGHTSGVFALGDGTGETEPIDETLRNDDATLDEDGGLPDRRSDLTVDFGFFRGIRIGNQVFADGEQGEANHNNGVFDAGEDPIVGVTVELWLDDGDNSFDPADDTLLGSTMTDTEGNYLFDDLDPDTTYFVAVPEIPAPQPGEISSNGQSAMVDDADNDDDGEPVGAYASVSRPINVTPGGATTGEVDTNPNGDDAEAEANAAGTFYPDSNSELTIDLGFVEVPIYRIGNLVWEDANNDGVASDGEPGIAGVLVQLLDEIGDVVAETATDADGHYVFENLIGGDYRIRIPVDQTPAGAAPAGLDVNALDGYQSSTNGEEADADDDGDNNDNGLGVGDWVSSLVTLGETLSLSPNGDEPSDETLRADNDADDDPNTGEPGFYPDDLSNLSVDFGFFRLALGNQVWLDVDDDGIKDVDENGIEGVTVDLYDTSGPTDVLVATTTTDADGLYLFERLIPGIEYVVEIPASEFDGGPLDGLYSSTDPSAGPVDGDGDESTPNDGVDGDDNGADPAAQGDAVRSLPVVLQIGDEPTAESPDNGNASPDVNENLSIDFGFHAGGRIGSLVWIDDGNASADDENGIADPSESGVDGVTLELYADDGDTPGAFDAADTLLDTEVTADGGVYEFGGLAEGDYFVVIPADQLTDGTPLDGHVPTRVTAATDTNNDSDGSFVDGVGVVSPLIELGYGTEPTGEPAHGTDGVADEDDLFADANSNLTFDFGFIEDPTYRIGNLVWEDQNNDGVATVDEPGIAGVLVQLLDDNGDVIAETVTDTDGHYGFDGLEAGDYQVRIPSAQEPQIDLALIPSPGALDNMRSSGPNETDANDDGDNNDNGLGEADWTSSVLTVGEDGLGGEPENETWRSDDPADDDPNAGNPASYPDGRSNLSVDFGFYNLSLGNTVWFDWDNSGDINGADETGVEGVRVILRDSNDDIVAIDTTDADGNYLFEGLLDGAEYVVEIDPSNFAPDAVLDGYYSSTGENVGGDPDGDPTDEDDNGLDVADGGVRSEPVLLSAGDEPLAEPGADNDPNTADGNENLTVDFGFYTMTVGNQVWFDGDRDGVIDAGEPPISGVTVELVDPVDGTVLATTTTDNDGLYLFTGLAEGDYQVQLPASNFDEGAPLEGLSSSPPSNVDPNDVTDDDDDNGSNGTVPASGPFTLTAGDAPAPTGNASNAQSGVPAGNQNLNIDFGFHALSLGNLVFIDLDGNGVFDEATESGRPGVTVELFVGDGAGNPVGTTPIATQITDDDGHYLFTDLVPGEYLVRIPAENGDDGGPLFGYISTIGNGVDAPDPDTDATDSDDNGDPTLDGDVWSDPVELVAGAEPSDETDIGTHADNADDSNSNLTVDFGFEPRPGIGLGNRIWDDFNGNGVIDIGEPGIDGVTVELYDADGTFLGFDVTDNEGYYYFPGLEFGEYVVVVPSENFDEPTDALWGKFSSPDPEAGVVDPDDDVDNQDNGGDPADPFGDVVALPISLIDLFEPLLETDIEPPGDQIPSDPNANLTVDFGFVSVSLGGTVFEDPAEDGAQDGDDVGVEGVTINLLDENGEPVLDGAGEPITTMTDENGDYLFEGIAPGTYVIEIPADQFDDGAPLDLWYSTRGNDDPEAGLSPDPDDDADFEDNGDPVSGDVFSGDAVRTQPVTVGPDSEPGDEPGADSSVPDANVNLTIDLGFVPVPPLELGGMIWIDPNNDGALDADEVQAPEGVVLALLAADGTPVLDDDGEPVTTTTRADGSYLFTGLVPGDYIVEIVASNFVDDGLLDGLWPSSGPSVSADPDDDLTEVSDGVEAAERAVRSVPVTLYPESEPGDDPDPESSTEDNSNRSVDFGVYETVLEGTVWFDRNDNGVRDDFEKVSVGVPLVLVDDDGEPVLDGSGSPITTETDEDGNWTIDGLKDDGYRVGIPSEAFDPGGVLHGYIPSKAPDNDAFDTDGEFGSVVVIITASDEDAPTIDLGFRLPPPPPPPPGPASPAYVEKPVFNGFPGLVNDEENTPGGFDDGPEEPGGPLAFTGGTVKTPLTLAASLLVSGAVLVGISKRRREED